jgi:hypothetical protein
MNRLDVTLNGRPAMIVGANTRFPRVVDIETGLGAEWSHEAIERVLAAGGAFES